MRIGRGLLRAFLDLDGAGAFALPVVIVFVVIEPPNETARMFVAAYFAAILIVRLASLVSRIVFAPAAPALRMVPARDEDARYLHRRVLQVAAVWAFGAITCELMLQHGLAIEAYRLLSAAVGLVVIVLFSSMFWHFRTPVGNLTSSRGRTSTMRTSKPTRRASGFARRSAISGTSSQPST